MNMAKFLFSSLLLLTCLSACSTNGNYAPISDRYNPSEKVPPYYIVSAGDTLFSIAWRYGFDVQGLATANRISRPYTIYPGQAIMLQESSKPLVAQASMPNPAVKTSVKNSVRVKSSHKPQAHARPPLVEKKRIDSRSETWRWPLEGAVVRAFVASGQAHKGIDIKGKMGEPVHASKSGEVVYAGNGLVGYGNLLILKHSEMYLSAYGHNRRLLVKEGDKVKSGDVIAELGDSGTYSAKLHFEVRVNGKPVDPLTLLPGQGQSIR
jgi:lipoprotein NlpD